VRFLHAVEKGKRSAYLCQPKSDAGMGWGMTRRRAFWGFETLMRAPACMLRVPSTLSPARRSKLDDLWQ
jgi:hypothetical protein